MIERARERERERERERYPVYQKETLPSDRNPSITIIITSDSYRDYEVPSFFS